MGKVSNITAFAEKIPGDNKYDKFQHMVNYGYDEAQIKKELNIKKKTYRNYMSRLEYSVDTYLHHLAKIGHISNMTKTLQGMARDVLIQEKIRDIALKTLEEDPSNNKSIYNATNANVNLSKMRGETFVLQRGTPLASAFREFIKKNIIQRKDTGNYSNNKYHLSVLPKDVKDEDLI